MSVNSISNAALNANLYNLQSGVVEASLVRTMSADDIVMYVRSQLGSIDGQLNDYKNIVVAKQKKSEELREVTALLRELKGGRDELKGGNAAVDTSTEPEKYNRLMTLLAKNSDSASAKSAYDGLLDSYGGYQATETIELPDGRAVQKGEVDGIMAGADPGDIHDVNLNAIETQSVMDNVKQSLEGINSDNEMVMMELQKLMQQRNQITQFASNALNVDNETKKGVIGNIR